MPMHSGHYYDLNVAECLNRENIEVFLELGYNVLAINQVVHEDKLQTKKEKGQKKKGQTNEKVDPFPEPVSFPHNGSLTIINRVTIEFSDSVVAHKMNQSDNLKKFDIIAVLPKTVNAFQYACNTMDIDIITFDPTVKLPIKLNRKLYRAAVGRQIHFELPYSPAIRDSTCRKNIIATSHQYHAVGRSKNIIISSAAEDHMYARGVYDIINLGLILGLSDQQCKEAITTNPRKVLLKAESRRRGKMMLQLSTTSEKLGDNVEESLEPETKKMKIVDS